MKLCQLCKINQTDDVYHICHVCRDKAARKWPTYREWIYKLENPQPVTAVADEPGDVDFIKAMGW